METIMRNGPLNLPRIGDVVSGGIIGFKKSAIFVDLGAIGTGVIYSQEFQEAKESLKALKAGDKIFAKITDLDNEEGYIELSLREASRELAWKMLQEKKEKNETIVVKIAGANKGGLLTKIANIPAFLPVSHLSFEHYPRVEEGDKIKIVKELQKFVGKELEVKIYDINPAEERVILSEKIRKFSELKELCKELKVGAVIDGEVTGIVDFGAFVRFSLSPADPVALEGLIHISEFDWRLINDLSEVVKLGQKVKAKIIEINDNRISLSLKALREDPWKNIAKKYKKGDTLKGLVTKFNPFGAFVQIALAGLLTSSIQGLVHISEFGTETKMKKILELGKEYDFEILQIDPEAHKMSLKMKE